jgi:hypothetical protein
MGLFQPFLFPIYGFLLQQWSSRSSTTCFFTCLVLINAYESLRSLVHSLWETHLLTRSQHCCTVPLCVAVDFQFLGSLASFPFPQQCHVLLFIVQPDLFVLSVFNLGFLVYHGWFHLVPPFSGLKEHLKQYCDSQIKCHSEKIFQSVIPLILYHFPTPSASTFFPLISGYQALWFLV